MQKAITTASSPSPGGGDAYLEGMKFRVLGPVEAADGGQRLQLGGAKQRTVLAVLVAHAGVTVSTDRLIESTWGEAPPHRARRSLQTYISNLRGIVGDVIRRDGSGYRLDADRSAVDAMWFEDEVLAAQAIEDEPEEAAERLRSALAVWRGHPYDDVDGGPELDSEIARLNELRLAAIGARIDADLAAGHHHELIGELNALTNEYPFHERFRAQEMTALFRAGRQAEALRAYQKTRSYLGDELGLEPSPGLRELEQRVLDQDESLLLGDRKSITRRAVMVADIDTSDGLAEVSPADRARVIDAYGAALDSVIGEAGGELFARRGSATYATFASATQAVAAAEAGQRRLASTPTDGPGLRMAIDVGDVEVLDTGEVTGPPVSRSRGLVAAAHGGQVLLSPEAQNDLGADREAVWQLKALGSHSIAALSEPTAVYQLVVPGLPREFPPLRSDGMAPGLPSGVRGLRGYELRAIVGRGSFGVIHRAYQASVGREVAIKVIRPDLANDVEFIRRFEVEAQLVARLEHPHIVPLYDYWRDPDGAYLVMRWIGGGSLANRLAERGEMTVDEVAQLVTHLAPALDAAHRAGVIHRDLKPSNILIDADDNAYLTDFGIAYDVLAEAQAGLKPADARTDVAGLASVVRQALKTQVSEPVAAVLEVAAAPELERRHASIDEFVADWDAALAEQGVAATPATFTPTRNPYKGLAAFQESDAEDFHGRDDVVAALVEAIAASRFVAVVGPSGIGKSSVVRAGLIPALRSDALDGSASWLITDMIPGAYPFESLASALLRIGDRGLAGLDDELRADRRGLVRATQRLLPGGSEALLVIDQLEELFTLGAEEGAADRFLDAIAELIEDPTAAVRVVVTLRADFFDRPLRHARFGELLRSATVPLPAPSDADLAAIVRRPAENLGVGFAPGLVERIVSDVSGQPSALPLLEFALTELFSARTTNTLTASSYEGGGGVLGALAKRAEEVFEGLDPAGQRAARQTMLRLVHVSAVSDATRRRVRRSELQRLGVAAATLTGVLDAFGAARLLAFDRDAATRVPTVEVTHESMFTKWERLAGWIESHRDDLVLSRGLAAFVEDWGAADRDPSYLLTGGRLSHFEAWASSTNLVLTTTEKDFLQESRDAEDGRAATRRRRRRSIMAGFGMAAVIALVLAVVAQVARNRANEEASLAQARKLIKDAEDALELDPDLSGLLTLEAIEAFDAAGEIPGEAVTALRRAIAAQRVTFRVPGGRFVAVHPDGSLLATADGNGVAVWDLNTREVVERYDRGDAESAEAAFSPDGNLLAVYFQGVDPPVAIWNRTTGESFDIGTGLVSDLPEVAFSDAGDLVAFSSFLSGVQVWSVESREMVFATEGFGPAFAGSGVMSHGLCAEAGDLPEGCEVRIVDTTTGQLVRSFATEVQPVFTDWSPDGSRIVAADQLMAVVHDAVSGQVISETSVERIFAPRWLPSGEGYVTGSEAVPRIIDADTGEPLLELQGQEGGASHVEIVPGASLVASAGLGGDTVVFDISALGGLEVDGWIAPVETTWHTMLDPDGERAIVADQGNVVIADLRGGNGMTVLAGRTDTYWFPVPSRDGSLFPMKELNGRWTIRRTDTADLVYEAPEGWSIHGVHPPTSRAVIYRALADGMCEVELVSMTSDAPPVELPEAGCLGKAEFSPNGEVLVTHNLDEFVAPYITAIFEAETGKLLRSLEGPFDGLVVDFTPDGNKLVTIGITGTLGVFDLQTLLSGAAIEEATLLAIGAHDGLSANLVVSPDGSMAITSLRNESMKLWSLETGELLSEFGGDLEGRERDVGAFHPTEPRLLVASPPNLVRVHTLDVDELVDIARTRFTREMTDDECKLYLRQVCEG